MSNDVKREFVFGTYCKSKNSDVDDLLVVKEYIHHPDGKVTSNLKQIKNYEKTFYITKKEFQDHEQKKEFEYIYKCDEYTCTQAGLVNKAKRLLKNYGARTITDVNESPYIYGTDITTPVLLHYEYNKKWPGLCTNSTMAVMDYETNVITDDGKIICGSITFKDKACLAVCESFIERFGDNAIPLIQEKFKFYLQEHIEKRKIVLEIEIVKDPKDVVIQLFKRAHKWQMDFLGFWNMSFDINKILMAIREANIPPEEVFSDPSIPKEFKTFYWKEDQLIRIKADGKQMSKHVADLWHSVTSPASFYCVDLMCLFKRLRVREKQRNSYSLDAILKEELGITKLKFEEANDVSGLDWHIKMQKYYPIEYLIYNIFDCISVELLDEKTNDVSKGLRASADITEIRQMNSNPKRLADTMYFILQDEKKVIASIRANMSDELDQITFSKNGWIIALAAELQKNTGRNLIEEYPNLETNIITHAFDQDIASGYPTFGAILNVSKGTSRYEVYGIDGLKEGEVRSIGINLSAPKTNAVELCKVLFNYPSNEELLEEFIKG